MNTTKNTSLIGIINQAIELVEDEKFVPTPSLGFPVWGPPLGEFVPEALREDFFLPLCRLVPKIPVIRGDIVGLFLVATAVADTSVSTWSFGLRAEHQGIPGQAPGWKVLEKYLSMEQVRLLDIAFARGRGRFNPKGAEEERAAIFLRRCPLDVEPEEEILLILLNMRKNGGLFLP